MQLLLQPRFSSRRPRWPWP